MTYKTHGLTGIVLSLLYMLLVGLNDPLPLIVAWFAALIPDLDHPKSWLSRRVPILPKLISSLCKHRGFTHSLLGLFLFTLIFFLITRNYLSIDYTIYFAIGYFSHLLADSLTVSGVNFFYPDKTKYGLRLIKTNSTAELLFSLVLIISIVIIAPMIW
ncbi:metal-dependent hydrolase [Natroniella acetigena]|uniref:metal-dependent hydrolase n=1 Tax=Natroniella acetigena TaxID=52004 RepID=UPI00200AA3C3|nr:metal-dependent hydrolase [Natroniella acetigena]MCK8826439.1 metal-dependent hydrolase [Natroniella acetigena]